MSLSTSATEPASGCVVLRVKRQREEDPAEALIVAKHSKLETGKSVFHFVGTLREDASDRVILDRLKHYRDRSDGVKSNPLARLTLEDSKTENRDRTKAKSSAQRFKVTSHLRCLGEGCGPSGGGGRGERCSPVTGGGEEGEEEEEGEGRGATAASGPTGGVKVHICDVHQEDLNIEDWLSGATAEAAAVTCNGSEMLREKVEHKKSGYVYDLYCAQEPEMLNVEAAIFDWSSLSVYEHELVHDIIDDMEEETCDDEDDSNDENNWRNDYPDEEGSTHSSDSELDDCGEYRHRQALYSSDEEHRYNDYL